MAPNQIAFYPQSSGGAGLPTASGAGQVPTSTGAGTTYTAQSPAVTLIAEQTLTGTPTTVTFSAIPQTFKHLKLIWAGNNVGATISSIAQFQLNGVTSGYAAQAFICAIGATSFGFLGGFSQTSIAIGGTFGEATFNNYTSAAYVQGQGGGIGPPSCVGYGGLSAGGPVTSFTMTLSVGTWAAGGTFSLYGLN